MSLKQRKIKFEQRIKLNHNIYTQFIKKGKFIFTKGLTFKLADNECFPQHNNFCPFFTVLSSNKYKN